MLSIAAIAKALAFLFLASMFSAASMVMSVKATINRWDIRCFLVSCYFRLYFVVVLLVY
jgi:hypothetical protein